MNKQGQTTIFLVLILFGVLLVAVFLVVAGILSGKINTALNQDIMIGQSNLSELSGQTIGKFDEMVTQNADWWGIAAIFGMVGGLFLSSYFLRGSYPKIGLLIDIGIIFVAFIISLYIKFAYSSVVVALNSAGETFAIDNLTYTNFFMLNMPIFVAIIGIVMMVLFHSSIPPKIEELEIVPRVVAG